MKEIFEIFSYLADAVSFIWKKAQTDDERQIKMLNWVILLLVTFTITWSGYILIKKQQVIFATKPEIVEISYVPSKTSPTNLFAGHFSSNVLRSLDSNDTIPLIISPKASTNQFYYGETVVIKSFGVYGIVHEKTLSAYGYIYTVRYKDNSHTLRDVDCYTDEIFRPTPGSVPPSALIN